MLGTLAITLILLPGAVSFRWAVQHPIGPISAARGSAVVIPCLFMYPNPDQHFRVLSVMWCRNQSHCITPKYVYHSEGIFPEPRFQGRVEYLGDMVNNCTLKINNLMVSDSGTYVFRFITDHPVEKLPGQMGITLLVTDSTGEVSVTLNPSNGIVEGSSVTLTCTSDANPQEQRYTWYKKNDTGVWQTGFGQNLTFSDLKSWNNGQYYCEVHDKQRVQNSTAVVISIGGGDRTAIVWTIVGIISIVALLVIIVGISPRKKISAPKDSPTETVALAQPSDHDKASLTYKLPSSETQ